MTKLQTLLALLLAAIMATSAAAQQPPADPPANPRWSLAIHGGAGVIERANITPERDAAIRAALDAALAAGSKVLADGGSAMDAVTAAILLLEDDPNFNAGKGAVFTWDGTHTLDASIMDGRDRSAGAVAGTTRTKNPILLARAVMTGSPHVLLSGEGADQFSREAGLEQVENSYFSTPERRRALDVFKASQSSARPLLPNEGDYKYGTVGAVARDSQGNLAAGTSTGGLTGKRWGRIGDAPIIGAGTYADNRNCAVSATGWGEYFIRVGVAHEICARLRFSRFTLVPPVQLAKEQAEIAQRFAAAVQQDADAVMADVKALGGDGGVILVTPEGNAIFSFNTPGMYRGRADSNGLREVAIYGDE